MILRDLPLVIFLYTYTDKMSYFSFIGAHPPIIFNVSIYYMLHAIARARS